VGACVASQTELGIVSSRHSPPLCSALTATLKYAQTGLQQAAACTRGSRGIVPRTIGVLTVALLSCPALPSDGRAACLPAHAQQQHGHIQPAPYTPYSSLFATVLRGSHRFVSRA
jgi:hypothetical protein